MTNGASPHKEEKTAQKPNKSDTLQKPVKEEPSANDTKNG